MTATILDLCRRLPDSEPELRARTREFGALLGEHVLGWTWRKSSFSGCRCLYPPNQWPRHMTEPARGHELLVFDWDSMPLPDPWELSRAKAATDMMIARGWRVEITSIESAWMVEFWHGATGFDLRVVVTASTEALARAAAALLAASEQEAKDER